MSNTTKPSLRKTHDGKDMLAVSIATPRPLTNVEAHAFLSTLMKAFIEAEWCSNVATTSVSNDDFQLIFVVEPDGLKLYEESWERIEESWERILEGVANLP